MFPLRPVSCVLQITGDLKFEFPAVSRQLAGFSEIDENRCFGDFDDSGVLRNDQEYSIMMLLHF